MSRYGNYDKEKLFDDMRIFVESYENGVAELLKIVSDVVCEAYCESVDKKEKELEELYGGYKEKIKAIEEMF